jgi:hypothetical protein
MGNGNGTVVVPPPAKAVEKRYLLAASTKASNFSNHQNSESICRPRPSNQDPSVGIADESGAKTKVSHRKSSMAWSTVMDDEDRSSATIAS